jgi:uncharacterized membrane protein
MNETIQPSEENQIKKEIIVNESVPNATAVLVLGILSIIFCWCWGIIGLILGIIGLILGAKSKKIYNEDPGRFSIASYKNLNAGYVCALIGTILSGLWVLILVISIIFGLAIGTSLFQYFPWEDIFNSY